jgi:hypothetical protein
MKRRSHLGSIEPELCTGGSPSWHLRQRFDLDFAFHGSDSDLSFASRF